MSWILSLKLISFKDFDNTAKETFLLKCQVISKIRKIIFIAMGDLKIPKMSSSV